MNKIAKSWHSFAKSASATLASIEHSVGYFAGQRAMVDPFKHEIVGTYEQMQAEQSRVANKQDMPQYYAISYSPATEYESPDPSLHHNCKHRRFGGFWRGILGKKTDTICCVDYSIAELNLRFADKKEGEHHSIARARVFRDSAQLEKLIGPPGFNWDIGSAMLNSGEYHTVYRHDATNFIERMFNDMPKPKDGEKSYRHFLVSTPHHAMTLTLKIRNKGGDIQYSTSWYDPNMTYNHLKTVHYSAKAFKNHVLNDLHPYNDHGYFKDTHIWYPVAANCMIFKECGPNFMEELIETTKHPKARSIVHTWDAEHPHGDVKFVSRGEANRACLKHWIFGE